VDAEELRLAVYAAFADGRTPTVASVMGRTRLWWGGLSGPFWGV
jgi:hypothetical protein